MIKKEEVYKIGLFNKPHGIHGELQFTFTDDIFDRVDCDYLICLLDGIFVPFFIEEYRFRSDSTALVKLEGIDTAERARMFTNVEVYFPVKHAEEAEDGELSWNFFVGFRMEDVRHGELGEVVEVDTATVNTLFVVEQEDGEELLVPAQEELIKMPRKRSKAFWNNFKFKYKLTIINENTLEEIVGLRVSKLNGLSVLLSVLAVLFLIAACIIAFTPLRNYLPGYMNSEVRSQIVDNALRVDSLQELLNRQNLYIMNIQDIFSGKVPIDSVQTLDSLTAAREDTLMERTKREEEFRRQYEENEKYNLTTIVSQPDVNGLILYRPTRGMVSDHFNADKKHFGTDIAANPNESVLATMDGTVFLSTYTAETGYVIGVQHSQDFVSIYKHCGSLLKKEGDRVKGGEAIALVGNSGTLSTGPHLHFELWYKGHPVNPEKYIVF